MVYGKAKIGYCGDGRQSLKAGIYKMCSDEMVKVSAEEAREVGGRGAGQRKSVVDFFQKWGWGKQGGKLSKILQEQDLLVDFKLLAVM